MSGAGPGLFAAAYVVVALLLVNVLCCTRWMWWVKTAAVGLVVGLGALSYQGLPALFGWPATDGLPRQFNLVGLHIVEPEKGGANKGAIYLWVTDLKIGQQALVPRAFELPFDPALQLKAMAAGTKLHRFLPQLGEVVSPGRGRPAHGARPVPDIEFFDLPDPLFPEQ